jgi:cell division protease FtsH
VAGTIDDEVKILIDRAYAQCESILKRDEEKLMNVVEYLLKYETMSGAQFESCMKGEAVAEETSETILFEGFAEETETTTEE